jgi:DNA-directed RNA polymerase specialized sigma24 family protein
MADGNKGSFGSELMFEQWLEEARKVAYRVVLHRFNSHADACELAENAASDAVVSAVRRGERRFGGEPEDVIRFVCWVAVRRARTAVRSRWRRDREPLHDDTVASQRDAINRERREFVEHWLAQTGSQCRDILVSYYLNGQSDMKIAQQLVGDHAEDADRQRIRTQRHECLSDMRRRLLEGGIDPGEWW